MDKLITVPYEHLQQLLKLEGEPLDVLATLQDMGVVRCFVLAGDMVSILIPHNKTLEILLVYEETQREMQQLIHETVDLNRRGIGVDRRKQRISNNEN